MSVFLGTDIRILSGSCDVTALPTHGAAPESNRVVTEC
jgi:hypothetical protein